MSDIQKSEKNQQKLFSVPADISEETILFNMFVKDGIVHWKRENGEVMKIGGSGCGKTRYFGKPDLMPIKLRGENFEKSKFPRNGYHEDFRP